MIRHLTDIAPVTTSHGVGQKRVLLSSNESGCSLTQIAVTELKAGETAIAHVHPDMQEGFYVLDGAMGIDLDGKKTLCSRDTFVYVEKCTSHEMCALTDSRIMTIGCVIEASRNKLYPMLFKQNRKTLVWGTEDWTVSGVPNSESEVENGTWACYNLTEVISRRPKEILGRQTALKYNNQLPLLAKIIDAHQDLSIQVHPNDEMAMREHGKMGKTEMWYVIKADESAHLYAGFKEEITPQEYLQRIADGSITEVLADHQVKTGDVFYLPAGRVHAICGGILLAEVQQSSDVTYRIYDYNRLGLDGKPRELHTELAAKALDYHVEEEYRTAYSESPNKAIQIIDTPYFDVRVLEISKSFHRNMKKYDSFIITMCIEGDCKILVRSTSEETLLKQGNSTLIPAAIADYDIIPQQGTTRILDAFIDNMDRSLSHKLTRFLHLTN